MAANGATYYYYYNTTDKACDSYLQRMDFTLSQHCTVNATINNNASLTCAPTLEKLDSARYSKGCVLPTNLPSVYLISDAAPLVVFNQFADSDTKCSSSSLVGGTQYAVDTCVSAHSETGFQTFEGRQIQSEYVSANMSNGQLIRSFFSDNDCTNYVSSVPFDNKLTACQSHMSATVINPLIYQRLVFYRDDACTLTNTIRYEVSNKVDCVPNSFCGKGNAFPQEKTCVNNPTLSADATTYFKNNPYAIFDYYQDNNCMGLMRSSAVAMNVCRLITGNKSSNITALPDGSFVSTTYNGPGCTLGVNGTVKFNQNGACTDSVRMTAYNFASILGSNGAAGNGGGSSSPAAQGGSNMGPIIGGVVGAVVVLGALGGFLYMRNKKQQDAAKLQEPAIYTTPSQNNFPSGNSYAPSNINTFPSGGSYAPTGEAPLPLPPSQAQYSTFDQNGQQTPTTPQSPYTPHSLQSATGQYTPGAAAYNRYSAPLGPPPPTQFASVPAAAEFDAARQPYYAPSVVSSSQPSVGYPDESTTINKSGGDASIHSQGTLPLKAALLSSNQSFLNTSLSSPNSAFPATLQPIQIGKVTLPMNPATWSVAETALWIVENGGSSDSARLIKEQDVDGRTLLKAKVTELADALEIRTLGQRVRFEEGVEVLRAMAAKAGAAAAASAGPAEGGEAPPAYFMMG
ncbi:hypothetical protein HDU81_001583 [Chytriomyces hyalinus]|nr:hypothetical protein HDU81_001583 [Chytriomyces hyalinus]